MSDQRVLSSDTQRSAQPTTPGSAFGPPSWLTIRSRRDATAEQQPAATSATPATRSPVGPTTNTASSPAEHAALLATTGLFAGLDRVTLAKLAAHVEPVSVSANATVVRQGEPADGMYLVSRGRFEVSRETADGERRVLLGLLGRGDLIGEMGLLTGEPRSATVTALGDGELLWLDRTHFLEIASLDPSVPLSIAATLSRRLRSANAALAEQPADGVLPDQSSADSSGTRSAAAEPSLAAATSPVVNLQGQPGKVSDAACPTRTAAVQRHDLLPGIVRTIRGWRPNRVIVGLALAIMVLAVGWVTAPPAGLTPAAWRVLWTLAALVPMLALDVLPDGVAALALAAVWVVGGAAPARVVFGGFASESWMLMVSVMAVGAAVASCGLLYRLVLWAAAHARGGFVGQISALSLAGIVVGAAVPNATTRVSLVAPATAEIAETLGYQPGGRAAAGLALAVFSGFGCIAPFLTSSSVSLMAFALLPVSSQAGLTWGAWLARSSLLYGVIFAGLLALVLVRYRPRPTEQTGSRRTSGSLAFQREVLGRPSGAEWAAGLAIVLLVVGFATEPLRGVQPAWIGVAALVLLALTRTLTPETLRSVNWDFALVFGMLAGMADVVAGTGLDQWLASQAQVALAGLCAAPILFVLGLAVVCFGVSLLLRWVAAVPLLTIALGPVASGAGIDPWIVVIVALVACNGFLLPYQNTTYLAMYHGTEGRLFSHAQARPLALAYWALVLIGLGASLPLWRLMGLL